MGKDLNVLGDHGKPKVDNSKRTLPLLWMDPDERFFTNTTLRCPKRDRSSGFRCGERKCRGNCSFQRI